MPTPLREAAFAAIQTRLLSQMPTVPVERNRRGMPDLDTETLPRMTLRDGDQANQGSDAHGTNLIRVQPTIEAWVVATTDAGLGPAANSLHASIIAAVCNQEIAIDGTAQAIWVTEEQLQMLPTSPQDSARPALGFVLQLGFDLRAPDAGGPYTTT